MFVYRVRHVLSETVLVVIIDLFSDVRDIASHRAVVDWVGSLLEGEGLNVLVNNAGVNHSGNFDAVTKEDMMEDFEVNAVGPLMVAKVLYTVFTVYYQKQFQLKSMIR